jgi:uncharacterized protein with ParB-like and HNH nuclease domain
LEVGESTLKTLIQGEKEFQVPNQRRYSWSTPQLRQLWDDIPKQYGLLAPDESGRADVGAPSYLLGSVVLALSPTITATGVTQFLIIDGQQRLTTLLVLLSALRDHAAAGDARGIERGPPNTQRWPQVAPAHDSRGQLCA